MNDKTDENAEKNIVVSINGKEVKRIPLKDAIKRYETIKNIVMLVIEKSSDIQAVPQFFVYINGKNVLPKDARHMSVGNVKTIEIFDKMPEGYTGK